METKGVAHKLDAKERTEDVRIKELAPFSKMLLSESVRKGLQAAGFMYPTVIQATAIPVGKSGLGKGNWNFLTELCNQSNQIFSLTFRFAGSIQIWYRKNFNIFNHSFGVL